MKYDMFTFGSQKKFNRGLILSVIGLISTAIGVKYLAGPDKCHFCAVDKATTDKLTDLYYKCSDACKK